MRQAETHSVCMLGTVGAIATSLILSIVVPNDQVRVYSATGNRESDTRILIHEKKSARPNNAPDAKSDFDNHGPTLIAANAIENSTNEKAETREDDQADHWWLPKSGQRLVKGVTSCGGDTCHSRAKPIDFEKLKKEGRPELELRLLKATSGWILNNEMTTWIRHDKHSQAYVVLLNERSQKIARIMKIVDKDGASVIHRDKRCLACHASFPLEQLDSDKSNPSLIAEGFASVKKLDFDTGVNCEGCHGPSAKSGNQKGWIDEHYTKQWRFKPSKEKFATFGYWDIRSPSTKAKICNSCHIGNVKQGKVITHEMYAAGHPPLPGFELATFINQEPQHWRDFRAKFKEVRQEFHENTGSSFDPESAHNTTEALIGALISLGESLRLSADLIDESSDVPSVGIPKPSWPEFANFACFNCHHELRDRSWRQERSTGVKSGLPNIHEWPLATVSVAVKFIGKEQEFSTAYVKVQQSISKTPFGDAEFRENAREVANWLDNLGEDLAKKPITREQLSEIMAIICDVAAEKQMDYDSTRQLVWLFSAVYSEWKHPIEEGQIPKKFKGWYPDEKQQDAVEELLSGMSEYLLLDLRRGRKAGQQEINGIKREIIEVDQEITLPKVNRFERVTAIQELFLKLKGRVGNLR